MIIMIIILIIILMCVCDNNIINVCNDIINENINV